MRGLRRAAAVLIVIGMATPLPAEAGANIAPELADVPATATLAELAAYSFTATATDPDEPVQALTFSLVDAPDGASIGAETGVFAWTPDEAQGPGEYAFSVVVSDGIDTDESTITLTVSEANSAPRIANVPTAATISELAPYAFTATAIDDDLPAQSLEFSLVSAPAGASIDANTGAFNWTPSEAQGPGEYPFTVQVSDGVATSDAAITLTVTEANAAPALANVPAAVTIPEQAAYTFTATASDDDLPVQTLTFELVGVPAGAAIDAGTGEFTWTPTEAEGPGEYPFTVQVSDGIATTVVAITLTVTEANLAPALASVPASATIPEQAAYAFTATAFDDDTPAQSLTFSLLGGPAGSGIDAGTGEFTWMPTEAQGPGEYPFIVQVSDGVATTVSAVTLTVTEANVAPVVTGVPATATTAEQAVYTFTAKATDGDLPAQPLTFSLSGAPTGASINPGSGTFTWTPNEAQGPGVYAFTVRAGDGMTTTDAAITLTVTEVNFTPAIAGVPFSATTPERVPYTFTATAADPDIPTQALTFSLVAAPSGAAIHPTTGVFTWTPTEAQGPGLYPILVQVSDGISSRGSGIFLTVAEVNVAPVLSGVPAAATLEATVPYAFSASATDEDAPVQALTFSLVGAPAGAGIGSGTGAFTWTPTFGQAPGTYPFVVRVTDGVAQTDANIALTVEVTPPLPITDLVAAREPGTSGAATAPIRVTWSPTPGGTTVEVYRAAFGGYPRYDDDGGVAPGVPTYPPGPPWVLTAVTAPDQLDAPPTRDFHHYVAFVNKAGPATSPASNPTAGTLNYVLGDVSDANVPGQGDNHVATADLSLLGAHYGLTGGDVAPFAYLDVGPTSSGTVVGRPLTDQALDFEDLVLFTLNFDLLGGWARVPSRSLDGAAVAEPDELHLDVSSSASVGDSLAAGLEVRGGGAIQAMSVRLGWNPAVVRPLGHSLGNLVGDAGGVLLSPRPGTIDVALLGVRAQGLLGRGTIGRVDFERIAAGDPGIRIEHVTARDAANQEVAVLQFARVAAADVPLVSGLARPTPNPFAGATMLAIRLAAAGTVDLALYSVDGRMVKRLAHGDCEAGTHFVTWDGTNESGRRLPAGVYYARLIVGGGVYRQSVVLAR